MLVREAVSVGPCAPLILSSLTSKSIRASITGNILRILLQIPELCSVSEWGAFPLCRH
jgi:hypothetical protein